MFKVLNEAAENSAVGRYFEFKERKTNLITEIQGGTATFLTMAYILAVNPMILGKKCAGRKDDAQTLRSFVRSLTLFLSCLSPTTADSGGPCQDPDGNVFSPEYETCLQDIKRQYVAATALCSFVACVTMGLVANLPIALSCGMGMNAYFTYNVVGFRGFGTSSYQAAMTAVLIEGCIFLFLAVTGARYAIVKLIPDPIRLATPAAIGCFLAHLGLQTAEGIGLVVSDTATAVTLGGCPADKRTPIVAFTDSCRADTSACTPSGAYTCDDLGGIMQSGTVWMGIFGLFLVAVLLCYRKKYSFIAGIAFVTIISWFRNTAVSTSR